MIATGTSSSVATTPEITARCPIVLDGPRSPEGHFSKLRAA
jgi:hypothetical protein